MKSTERKETFEESLNDFYKFMVTSTRIATVCTGSVLMIYVILHIVVPLVYFQFMFWADALLVIIPSSILLFCSSVLSRRKIINWRDQVFNILICIGYSFLNYMMIFWPRAEYAFLIVGVFGYIFIIALIGVVVTSLVNLVIYTILMLNSRSVPAIRQKLKERILPNIPNKKEFLVIFLIFFCGIGIPTLILYPPIYWNQEITIHPQNYDAKIAFWGQWHVSSYTEQQRESLNDHSVLIHGYGWSLNTPDEQNFIDNLTYWNTYYPNVKFTIAIPGYHNDFVSDIHYETTIEKTKYFVRLMNNNSHLKNVVGVSYDMEETYFRDIMESEGISNAPNRERHDNANQSWNELFEWLEENDNNNLKTYLINYVETAMDLFDEDNDIQLMHKYNAHEIPHWDKYVPMVYRAGLLGPLPYGEYPYMSYFNQPSDQAWLYYQLYYLYTGIVQEYETANRMGILLGIINASCYGRDIIQEEYDGVVKYGYDKLVEDSLMAKHFGVETITLFLANTVYQDGFAMGGAFATYGDDFLDKYDEAINGENSTDSFTIRWQGPPYWNYLGVWPFFQDTLLNLDSIVGILYFSLIIGLNVVLVFFKEIKEKVNNVRKKNPKD